MLAYSFEISAVRGTSVERGTTESSDEVALEEVRAGGERDGIGNGALQLCSGCGEDVEGFGDGGESGG